MSRVLVRMFTLYMLMEWKHNDEPVRSNPGDRVRMILIL